MGLLTRSLGWSAAEVEVFLVGLRKELNDKSLHVLDHWFVVPSRFSVSGTCSRSAPHTAMSSTAGNHKPFRHSQVNQPLSFLSGTRQRGKVGVGIGRLYRRLAPGVSAPRSAWPGSFHYRHGWGGCLNIFVYDLLCGYGGYGYASRYRGLTGGKDGTSIGWIGKGGRSRGSMGQR